MIGENTDTNMIKLCSDRRKVGIVAESLRYCHNECKILIADKKTSLTGKNSSTQKTATTTLLALYYTRNKRDKKNHRRIRALAIESTRHRPDLATSSPDLETGSTRQEGRGAKGCNPVGRAAGCRHARMGLRRIGGRRGQVVPRSRKEEGTGRLLRRRKVGMGLATTEEGGGRERPAVPEERGATATPKERGAGLRRAAPNIGGGS